MNYSIDFDGENITFKCIEGKLSVELIDVNRNKVMIKWSFFSGGQRSFNLPEHNVDRVQVVYNNTELRIFDVVKDEPNRLKEHYGVVYPDFGLPFTCITGYSGGGTSIVAKSLKHLGVNIGNDSGGFEQRKAFESVSMRTFVNDILTNESAPIRKSYAKALEAYKYNPNRINAFKITDLEDKEGLANGIGLSKLFKDIRFISVVKKSKGSGKTPEGRVFNETPEIQIYRNQHPKVQAPIFHLDWKRYFTDYMYVNEVLQFIGSDIVLNQGDFNEMLEAINFEVNLLKD